MGFDTTPPPAHRRQANRTITDEEFQVFLTWLAPDPEEAGRKYQEIHRCLAAIFLRRGHTDAEALADEAINRVIRRVAREGGLKGDSPLPFFIRVAYYVHLEQHRKKQSRVLPPSYIPPQEQECQCLEQCLDQLPSEQRTLLLRYYEAEKQAKIDGRKQLAEEFKLTLETLRLKIHRLRVRLRPCIEDCLAQTTNL